MEGGILVLAGNAKNVKAGDILIRKGGRDDYSYNRDAIKYDTS